jgi:hypothetical protein
MLMMLIYWAEEHIRTTKKNTKALAVVSKKIGLQVNADKTKYISMFQDQNAGRIYNTRADNSSLKSVEQFTY